MHIKHMLALSFTTLVFTGAGCFGGSTASVTDGGVFVSADKGATWTQRVAVPSVSGTPGTIANVSSRALAIDPNNRDVWYLGTEQNGVMYTLDRGNTWGQAKDLAQGTVFSVAVDPKDTCTLYATSGRDVVRSTDCLRSFQKVYSESREGQLMLQIAVDPNNSNIIYAASSSGDLVKSTDAGKTWAVSMRFQDEIRQIFVFPGNSQHIYVGLLQGGLRKSVDGGATWINVTPDSSKFSGATTFRALAWAKKSGNETFVLATRYGLFRTNNGGDVWEPLELVTAPGEVTIFGLAVNPANSDEIMYSTAAGNISNVFLTVDGGKTWSAKKAPSSRAMYRLQFDTEGTGGVVAATFAIPQAQ